MEAVAQTTGGREISNRSPGERIRGAADGCVKRKNEAEVRRRCGKAQHTGGEPALCNSLHG
jgi:hypothetical protein